MRPPCVVGSCAGRGGEEAVWPLGLEPELCEVGEMRGVRLQRGQMVRGGGVYSGTARAWMLL